jgi:uncharacterized protein DUF3996
MERRSLALLATGCLALTWVEDAAATQVGRSKDFGIGFALGSPTSIVAKYFVNPGNAFDFGLGFWRLGRYCDGPADGRVCRNGGFERLTLNMDYLWQEQIIAGSGAKLDWHIGGGGRVWLWDDYAGGDFALAARMPVGIDVTFPKPDFLEVFLELAPALYIVPGLDLDIEAFLGVRFYF